MADQSKPGRGIESRDPERHRRPIKCLSGDSIDQVAPALAAGDFVWLNLAEASDAEIDGAGAALDLHPLTVEDLQEFHQRAKVEDYGDYVYIVAYGASTAEHDEDGVAEVHVVFSPTFLATFAAEPTTTFDQLIEQASSRDFSRQELLHSVLDTLVDSFAPLFDEFDDAIEQIEERLIARELHGRELEIHALRRRLSRVDRIVHRQLEAFTSIRETLRRMPGHHPEDFPHFRDLQDHLNHVADAADVMRDRIAGLFELYMAALDNRQNVIMKQFTVIAGVFLPLSVLVGFFGMNFAWMVEHIKSGESFLLLGVVLPLAIFASLVALFAVRGLFRE